MNEMINGINIRYFKAQDAEICFKIRSAAFVQKFYRELGARATSAGVNAFMPEYNSGFYKKVGFVPAGKCNNFRCTAIDVEVW